MIGYLCGTKISNPTTALYLGNSDKGQLYDYTGRGRNLTKSGTVPTATSPTPPEGDQWLAYHATATAYSNFLEPPASSLDKDGGAIEFYYMRDASIGDNRMIVAFNDSQSPATQGWVFTQVNNFYVQAINKGTLVVNTAPTSMILNKLYRIRVIWGVSGFYVYLDGQRVISYANSFRFSATPRFTFMGDPWTSTNGNSIAGIDNLSIMKR